MRIVKLSTMEFDTLNDVRRFFIDDLRCGELPGKFRVTAGRIAQDGLAPGEPLLFTHRMRIVFTARAASGLVPNDDAQKQRYPNYFLVDLTTVREVNEDIHEVERQYNNLSGAGVLLVASQAWNRLPDSAHTAEVWTRLGGAFATDQAPPSPNQCRLAVRVESLPGTVLTLENVSPDERIGELVHQLLARLGLPAEDQDWHLAYFGLPLPPEGRVRFQLPITEQPVELDLLCSPPVAAPPAQAEGDSATEVGSDSEFELTLDAEGELSGGLDGAEGGKDAFEETNIDLPGLDEESGSEAVALDEADSEGSDFDLSLEEEDVSGSQVVTIDEDADDAAATVAKPRKTKTKAKPPPSEDEADLDLDLEREPERDLDEEEEEEPANAPLKKEGPSPRAKEKQVVARRATVRYYSKMNPERMYPLLVLITRQMVEKVSKKDTDQRTSRPFHVDKESPIEIEPILPGCDCHPPKVVARLGQGDLTLTFRVVPRVIGRVDGAVLSIRQDHASLAEVKLDVRVVKRTWVALSGAVTFLLPGLSSVLKHFGLDFEAQKQQGFSLYLATARLVFDVVPPLAWTAALGLLTGVLWWVTRPQARDVFWDIEKVGPREKLRRIAAAATAGSDHAATELMELMKAFPDYQLARLFYAEWHYNLENYDAALKGYTGAFKLGVVKARHYQKASFAASKLGQNETALRMLQTADRVLLASEMSGVMLYNMGCYHARLGRPAEAITCLRRAVKAGHRTLELFLTDPDLKPLRGRHDFKQLLASLENA